MNVTFSFDGETIERVREIARQQGPSRDALAGRSLAGTRQGEALAGQFEELWRERSGHSGGSRFNREELYQERLGRGSDSERPFAHAVATRPDPQPVCRA